MKTTRKAHPRKGTKGVRTHDMTTRNKKTVPHNVSDPAILSTVYEGKKYLFNIKYKGQKVNDLVIHNLTPVKDLSKGLYDRTDLYIYEIKLPDKTVFIAKHDSYWSGLTGGFANYSGEFKKFDSFRQSKSWLRKKTKIKARDMNLSSKLSARKDDSKHFTTLPEFLEFERN